AYLVLLVAGVVAYMNTVQSMITPLIAGEGFRDTLLENAQGIQSVAKGFYPARAFALLSYGTVAAFFINFGIILAGFLMLAAFAFFVAGLKYKKFYQEEHSFVSNFKSKSGYKAIGPQKAVLKKDILNIFRSSNYTFQFLLIVAITPLLIFYSNRIANFATFQSFNRFGEQGLSFGISFEISLFIVLVLIPLASSFAASNISREGHNIYHTKLIPVSFKKQLLIKTAIVFVPIFVAVTAGALLSMLSHDVLRGAAGGVMPGLSGTDVVVLLVIALFLSLGYISLGTYIDLRRPLCNQIGTGELTKATGHSNFIIILGSLLGVGFGVLGLFSAFNIDVGIRMNHNSFIGFVIAFAVLFGAAFTTLLFVDGERAYKNWSNKNFMKKTIILFLFVLPVVVVVLIVAITGFVGRGVMFVEIESVLVNSTIFEKESRFNASGLNNLTLIAEVDDKINFKQHLTVVPSTAFDQIEFAVSNPNAVSVCGDGYININQNMRSTDDGTGIEIQVRHGIRHFFSVFVIIQVDESRLDYFGFCFDLFERMAESSWGFEYGISVGTNFVDLENGERQANRFLQINKEYLQSADYVLPVGSILERGFVVAPTTILNLNNIQRDFFLASLSFASLNPFLLQVSPLSGQAGQFNATMVDTGQAGIRVGSNYMGKNFVFDIDIIII
ncbi:MAG: hypothetical protein FWD86_00525, partial [Firmicutes bacterium]|nr:hypothetical protein [Bacillota bacterium]